MIINSMGIVDDYLNETVKYKKSHGEKTVVLMQCGSFFEVYGLKDKQGNITGSDLVKVSEICELNIAHKKVCVGGKSVVMAGFGLHVIEKYLRKLNEKGYTCPVIVQDVQAQNSPRSLKGIYSPGTNFNNETNSLSNNILCLWLEVNNSDMMLSNSKKPTIICGSSCVDIYTGKCYIQQFTNEYLHNPATFDELEKFVSIYNPCETLIIHNLEDENKVNDVINYVNIQSTKIHKIKTDTEKVIKCEKQTYQKQIIDQFYLEKDKENIYADLSRYDIACQSLCYLLNFLYESNPDLISKIHEPHYETAGTEQLITANHSLKQLNIIEDNNYKGKLSSIVTFLNNAVTPMGKREFQHILLHPISKKEELTKEYDITEYLIKGNKLGDIRTEVQDIKDLEKLNRRLILKEITPVNFSTIYGNIETIKGIYKRLSKDKTINKYISEKQGTAHDISKISQELLLKIKTTLDLNLCKTINTQNIDKNIINKGVFKELDEKVEKWHDNNDILECIRKYFNNYLLKYETEKRKTAPIKNTNDYVKIHETEKSGCSLQLTARRGTILAGGIPNGNITLTYLSSYNGTEKTFELECGDVNFTTATGTNKNIMSNQLQGIYKSIFTTKAAMLDEVMMKYKDFIMDYIKLSEKFEAVIKYITILDVLQNKVYIANTYNLCKPEIKEKGKSYFNCKGIRHPLIEQLNTKELYVTNDIMLGMPEKECGMLIYGTNAVGKTSLIRALGICVIMAQAGLYVACNEMEYEPYTQIFTRILGNDNIFKGLSTFAVEMSELRTILKYANENSLILGDELCSGTETESATAIFMSGIKELHDKNASFIFATHFHEITDRSEITELKQLGLKHMTVRYDKMRDILIYDRLLKDGPGNSTYGLEVCKSLSMPEEFLKRAYEIRMKYNPKERDVLSMKSSHYNSKKLMGNCELCDTQGTEIHHMEPKQFANSNGYIKTFNKNHPANLMSICKTCHQKITATGKIHIKKKTTIGMILEEN